MVNNRKIAFIICVNNEIYFDECSYYIRQLAVPEDYEIDILAIRDAKSMCAAYNFGMHRSDAKYKIYMHQDVFICNEKFIFEILSRFKEHPDIGMLGVMGGTEMPKTGVTYLAWDVGAVDCRDVDMAYLLVGQPIMEDAAVEAIDGLLMVTQYDLPWREELFRDFDFYDVSQSFEMRKHGYRILVPFQEKPWVIHDSGFAKLSKYDYNRKICLAEYPEYFYGENGFAFEYCKEWETLSKVLTEQLKQFITDGEWQFVCSAIAEYRKGKMKDTTLEMLGIMSDIWQVESSTNSKKSVFAGLFGYEQIYERYTKVRFWLRRMELGMPESAYREFVELLESEEISCDVFMIFLMHVTLDKRKVLQKTRDIYWSAGKRRQAEVLEQLLKTFETTVLPMTYTKKVLRNKTIDRIVDKA